LIPNDVVIKLRVNNAYNVSRGKGTNNNHPSYQFKLEGRQASALTSTQVDSSLNLINIVPNPYYGYSAYEINEFSTTVKITNLPAKSTITIYTLDGKFIRQFRRDETPTVLPSRDNPGVRTKQIVPDVEWDMKNEKGIPVASGVYLIHVAAPGQGERTLKFFAVNRQFDASRL
jgi:flagellar hook assembly protein FlgD